MFKSNWSMAFVESLFIKLLHNLSRWFLLNSLIYTSQEQCNNNIFITSFQVLGSEQTYGKHAFPGVLTAVSNKSTKDVENACKLALVTDGIVNKIIITQFFCDTFSRPLKNPREAVLWLAVHHQQRKALELFAMEIASAGTSMGMYQTKTLVFNFYYTMIINIQFLHFFHKSMLEIWRAVWQRRMACTQVFGKTEN